MLQAARSVLMPAAGTRVAALRWAPVAAAYNPAAPRAPARSLFTAFSQRPRCTPAQEAAIASRHGSRTGILQLRSSLTSPCRSWPAPLPASLSLAASRPFSSRPLLLAPQFHFGGPGGPAPVPVWKVYLTLGGVVLVGVTGLALLAKLLGPWVLGGLALWWFWRSFSRYRRMYLAAGGSSNPLNPFRNGPYTPEARAAARVIRQQEKMGAIFNRFSPQVAELFAQMAARSNAGGMPGMGGMGGMSGMGTGANGGSMTEGIVAGSAADFLHQKMRATLVAQARRHPALQRLSGLPDNVAPRTRSVRCVVREMASGAGMELHVDEIVELLARAGTITPTSGKGLLTARYVLRLPPHMRGEVAAEMREWQRQQADMREQERAGVATVVSSEPAPLEGPLFSCLTFEQVSFTPRASGGQTVDLLEHESFHSQSQSYAGGEHGGSGVPNVQEAEFEEITPQKQQQRRR